MDVLVKVGQLLLSLSILIVLHEMGHFLTARWFKTRVEKFYLFFDAPPFNSLWKIKKGDTEYGIGWLPLGGYVKISGMVDESMDTEALKEAPKPWEFRSKPAWQRLIIMLGGVTVNFLLGILIFGFVKCFWGDPYIETSSLKWGVQMDSVLLREGFQNGDVLIKVGDKNLDRVDNGITMAREVVLNGARTAVVKRNGQEQTINLSSDLVSKLSSSEISKKLLMAPRVPMEIAEVQKGKPAAKVDIKKGDRVIAVNAIPVEYFDQFQAQIRANKGKDIQLRMLRGTDSVSVGLKVTDDGFIGVRPEMEKFFDEKREKVSIAGAIPAGYKRSMEFLGDQVKTFGKLFKNEIKASESLGGFISIGNLFPSEWHWESFWRMTAALSVILAFMNLLPIPALDGGYVLFLLWEVVTGKKVSDKFMERAVTVGFFLLLALMVYVNGLDVWRNWFK